ncbi:MAG: cadherin-like domain-containing protein, partial [Candidatus Saccharimonadales bacterium]
VLVLECLESRVLLTGNPVANADAYQTLHDHALTVAAACVLTNDTDPNYLALSALLETNPSHGTVSLNSNGAFTYTPAAGFTGNDSYTYEDYDGQAYSNIATVSIYVSNDTPTANNDTYTLLNGQTLNVAASGVLGNDNDADGDSLTASLASGPSHGALSLHSDGSFSYTPNTGWAGNDSFTYTASDGITTSNTATVTLITQYSVLSLADQTKIPVDALRLGNQILGGSGGAPATAQNLALAYDSLAGQPDQVIEADAGLSNDSSMQDTLTATLTFNGVQQPPVYYNMQTLNGSDSHIHLAMQVDTSALPTGRYAYSLNITSADMQAPATVSGAVNVVNDEAGPVGKGWDIPGLDHLYQNSASGVPAGMLLTTGDGRGWYFSGSGGSYTSPNGPYAFDTLTMIEGGWQLTDKFGVKLDFNNSGYETDRIERAGATT